MKSLLQNIKCALLITFLALLLSPGAMASSIQTGQAIPAITIEDKGELVLEENKVVYADWSTDSLMGKVHVLQYMAGRMSASKVNEAFTDALEKLELSRDYQQTTTIINLDDSMFGTSGFVNSELKSNKKKYPFSTIVADKRGTGASAWRLDEASSAIMVLSPDGKVLFFKDGGLSTEEIDSVITLIQAQMQKLSAAAE